MKSGLADVFVAAGLVLLDLGLWQWSHAAALIAGGIGAIVVGLVIARRESAKR